MKRILSLLLALLMLAALPTIAEEPTDEGRTYEVAFEGVEVQFPQSDWTLWVPAEWEVQAEDYDSIMAIGNGFTIHIECWLHYDESLESIYASLSRSANFKEDFITYSTINGFPVMTYCNEREYFDLGDGMIADFRINLVKPFLEDYEGTREMVYQMISSLHLPEEE